MNASVIGAAFAALLIAVVASGHVASADGTMRKPVSRVYNCYLDGVENPKSAACIAAINVAGKQPFYNWMEVYVNGGDNVNLKDVIPDGQLCSAGNINYSGLDLAREDWEATDLSSGVNYTFLYKARGLEEGGKFLFYVTKDDYDPTQPLKWSDLEDAPFLNPTDPVRDNDENFPFYGTTPAGKSGRHLIYVIWRHSLSNQIFVSCSDVDFDACHCPDSVLMDA